MPDLDGGHYFLTVLAPIRPDADVDPVSGASRSHRHLLAQQLALLPTGHQTLASPAEVEPSPFARNVLNHFARFAVIDGPNYNGRVSGDTLVAKLRRIDPLAAKPVDRLNASFLLFAADVDAREGAEAGLRAYTEALWSTMRTELRAIFVHCLGFSSVTDAASFHRYVERCQVETTMPFNDYWPDTLQVAPMGRAFLLPLIAAALALLVTVAAPVALALGGAGPGWSMLAILVGAGCIALALVLWRRLVLAHGAKPFPTAEGSDLPSVLKALFLQQQFARFASDAQTDDAATLHRRFGRFLTATLPENPVRPTQAPGVVRSGAVGYMP